ncbi:MAG: nucleotide sugar dehydrogenase [Candidatus Aminicenantia bacterium]
MNLRDKIKSRKAKIGIIGLGYVGLPLGREFIKNKFQVTGFDIDRKKINLLNEGKSYIKHISSTEIREFINSKRFIATDDFLYLKEIEVIIICVPTPLDEHRNPDLSYVIDTTQTIAQYLQPRQLIVLESTTYPGTTEEKLLPILESSGMKVGKGFYLAYSPERENPGDKRFPTSKIPKVVSGITPECLKVAKLLYDQIVVQTIPVSSPRVAEATKLLENIFRAVNIAMANEMKMLFDRMGIDIWEVIEAAKSKPFGFMPFYPGPGLGGHCIPIDPFYLSWKAKEFDHQTKFIELAGEINTFMPYYVISKTIDALNQKGKSIKGANILVLGISYKKDIDDQRESPSLKIIDLLIKNGAKVSYHDPYVPESHGHRKYPHLKLKSVELNRETLKKADCVIIATDHSVFDYQWLVKNSSLIIDTRNAIKEKRKNVIKA